jgi:hypothetical protein
LDQEAVVELNRYYEEINGVTLGARTKFWIAQFSILVAAFVLIYISIFIVTPASQNNQITLVPAEYANKILFLFFFGGFYQEQNIESLETNSSAEYWPFFVLMVLLVIEKFSTDWLSDRFGTDPAIISVFEEVIRRYDELEDKIAVLKQIKKERLANKSKDTLMATSINGDSEEEGIAVEPASQDCCTDTVKQEEAEVEA